MIASLHIKNIALIKELSIEFSQGLNILSGETGAGKSIIIDSLTFVLGDRADRSLIRYGEDSARVEVVFSDVNENVFSSLSEHGLDEGDDVVIVSRMMTATKSECRINGHIVNLSTLRNVVGLLVDVHSQNEHQSLMQVSNHIKILDEYDGRIKQKLASYRELLGQYKDIKQKLEEYSTLDDRERQMDILRYQIDEINEKIMKEGEEEGLLADRSRAYNLQKIVSAINEAVHSLGGANGFGGIDTISKAVNILSTVSKYDDSLEDYIDRLDSIRIEASDVLSSLEDKISDDGGYDINIDYVEKRLEEIRLIKKKYGSDIATVTAFLEKAAAKLDGLENAEVEVERLNKRLSIVSASLLNAAKELHSNRKAAAAKFAKAILSHLSDLGMKNTSFEIVINSAEADEDILASLNSSGMDRVEFMLSPNAGEPLKPLIKIASGGEMSRFMLALKNVIAEIDEIGTLVFDEIDTGISGRIAMEVAKKLYNIAKSRQVLAITHLPQLASMADKQYLISKAVVDGKTLTSVTPLDEQNMLNEIMRLAGSTENSEIGLKHAKELKNWAKDYKSSI